MAIERGHVEVAKLLRNFRPDLEVLERVGKVSIEQERLQEMSLSQMTKAVEVMEADEVVFVLASQARETQLKAQVTFLEQKMKKKIDKIRAEIDAAQQEEEKQHKLKSASDLEAIRTKKEVLRIELRESVNTQSSPQAKPLLSLIPECPACYEKMKPPRQIYNCTNGHLICSLCQPNITGKMCISRCGTMYSGRATAMEQMMRQMVGII